MSRTGGEGYKPTWRPRNRRPTSRGSEEGAGVLSLGEGYGLWFNQRGTTAKWLINRGMGVSWSYILRQEAWNKLHLVLFFGIIAFLSLSYLAITLSEGMVKESFYRKSCPWKVLKIGVCCYFSRLIPDFLETVPPPPSFRRQSQVIAPGRGTFSALKSGAITDNFLRLSGSGYTCPRVEA